MNIEHCRAIPTPRRCSYVVRNARQAIMLLPSDGLRSDPAEVRRILTNTYRAVPRQTTLHRTTTHQNPPHYTQHAVPRAQCHARARTRTNGTHARMHACTHARTRACTHAHTHRRMQALKKLEMLEEALLEDGSVEPYLRNFLPSRAARPTLPHPRPHA